MSTSIERVRRAFYETPWAMLPEKLEEIRAFLSLRAEGKISVDDIQARIGEPKKPEKMRAGGVAVLPLYGVVSQRADMMTEMSGGTSTEKFGADFDRLMNDPEVGTIILDVDSPGGSVPGVLELSDKIFQARGQGKKIIALANSLAASAAYWIASAADEFVVSPSADVGSIGVYSMHADYSRSLKNAGVDVTITKAGKYKAEGNPYEPLSEDAKAAAQERVDEIYDQFVGAVARNRGVTVAKVESGFGKGRVVSAKRAVAAGMADRIATLESLLGELGIAKARQQGGMRAEFVDTVARAVQRNVGSVIATFDAHTKETKVTSGVGSLAETRAFHDREPVVYTAAIDTLDAGGAVSIQEHTPEIEPAPEAREQAMSQQDTAAQNGAANQTTGGGGTVQVVDFTAERKRAAAITELCEMHGIRHEAADFINSGANVEDVVSKIRTRAESNLRAMSAPAVDLSPKEQKRYSITRAIMGAAQRQQNERVEKDDGFEREISAEIERSLPSDYKTRGGLFIPTRFQAAGLDAHTSTAGAEIVFTENGSFIDLLRNKMVLGQLGATVLTGLQGPVAFPKQTGAGTFTWVEENSGSDVSDSDATFAQVALNPKAGQSSTAYSRQLLAQGVIDIDNLVQNDLALITAIGIDRAGIAGNTGGNNPVGVLYTSGIGDVAGGANGLAPTYAHMVDLETDIATANADIGSMKYLTTPAIRGTLKKTQQFASTNGVPVWTGGMDGEVNGYPALVSNQVPSDLTKGTSTGDCHAIIFGVWSQLIVGYWGAYELVVDPYRLKKQGMIELTSFQMAGLAVRHAGSFSAMKDALLA